MIVAASILAMRCFTKRLALGTLSQRYSS